MHPLIKFSLLLAPLVLLASCAATSQKLTVDSMTGNGLVTAKMTSNYPYYRIRKGNIKISGKDYIGAIGDNGFLRLPLKPGAYTLEQVWNRSGDYIKKYPVTVQFEIYPAQITNLGSIILNFSSAKTDKFTVLFVDNNKDIVSFLKKYYPDVYSVVGSKEIRSGAQQYVSKEKLNVLKASLANGTSIWGTHYFAGILGSLATFTRTADNKMKNLRWINTGTLNDIDNCQTSGTRFYCIVESSDQGEALYVGEAGKFVKRKLPTAPGDIIANLFGDGAINLPGKKEVVLVTHETEIYTSLDRAKSWARNTEFKKTITKTSTLGIDTTERRGHKFQAGENGYYFYTQGDYGILLYRPVNSLTYRQIPLPAGEEYIVNLVETDVGLYEGPENTLFGDSSFNFLAKGSTQWVKRAIPGSDCRQLKVLNRQSDLLYVTCSDKFMLTENQGESWRDALRSEIDRLKGN